MIKQHVDRWGKSREFIDPIAQCTKRRDNQEGSFKILFVEMRDKGDRLQRFSKSLTRKKLKVRDTISSANMPLSP